jgi:hypothetical protein
MKGEKKARERRGVEDNFLGVIDITGWHSLVKC